MEKASVLEFARQNGYETAEYLCDWRGYKCYEPVFAAGKVAYIGLPLLILEDDAGKLRMSTPEEAMEQLQGEN